MSLQLVKTVEPCYDYVDVGTCWATPPSRWPSGYPSYYYPWFGSIYNAALVTCPKHFEEAFSNIYHFYYDPGSDTIRLNPTFSVVYWPGYAFKSISFDADGNYLSTWWGNFGDAWYQAYTSNGSAGSYGRIYGIRLGKNIVSLDPATANPDGVYANSLENWPGNPTSSFIIANVAAGYAVLGSGASLTFWRNIDAAPEKFSQLTLPFAMDYLCYESETIMWAIGTGGELAKINYQLPRLEMLSQVHNPDPTVQKYMLTFDTKRNRLVVFSQLPDAADGACQSKIEFYWPVNEPGTLTKPVPVNALRAGEQITFVAHLIGDAGEGIASALVQASLADPAHGSLITPQVTSEASGRCLLRYQAGEDDYTDSLTLSYEESS